MQCRSTLPPSLNASADARRLAPYIWTHQYTHLSPANCFVLDDGSGNAVGYCIGCPDVFAFCAAYDSYVQQILDPSAEVRRPDSLSRREPWALADGRINGVCLAQLAYNPAWLLLDGNEAVTRRYRSTLHIDLLPGWQRRGWGRKLLERVVLSLAGTGGGVWIGVAADNAGVVRFYEGVGFHVFERDAEAEADKESVLMVRDL